jgi:hypothetical protein
LQLWIKTCKFEIKTMNRISSFLVVIPITVIVIIGVTGTKANGQNTANKPVSVTIQADIYKIFQSSCIDCHAQGGKKSAMSHVNFSDWDNYSAEKKSGKAADIVKMLQKGKMPPKSYRESNPDKIPTPAQIESIVKWADSLPKK